MAELRIKGQEMTVRLARGSIVEQSLTAIADLTVQLDLATLDQGYLGEKTNRKDDIFNGVSGSLTLHPEGQEAFEFADFLVRRAQRDPVTIGVEVNLTARYTFPNGDTPLVLVKDLKFAALPIASPSRDAYISMALSYVAASARFITT